MLVARVDVKVREDVSKCEQNVCRKQRQGKIRLLLLLRLIAVSCRCQLRMQTQYALAAPTHQLYQLLCSV
jgi:hypothetical protein